MKKNCLIQLLVVCSAVFFTSCHEPEKVCKKCNAAFAKEKRVRQINYYDATLNLREVYDFYYKDFLVDSIVKTSHNESVSKTAEDIISTLRVFYPTGQCTPSYYVQRTVEPGSFTRLEKAFMSTAGPYIVNKHLAFYPDESLPVADHSAEIDYVYNPTGKVIARNGTDYSILLYPNVYSNENSYTYTGENISKVDAEKEQGGYNLTKIFDANNNPFNIQGGVMYFLSLIAYNDEEYFETIARDDNNVTEMVYKGTDTSNSHVTITFTFTYSYLASGYPSKVSIHEVVEDEIYGDTDVDHGTYKFDYY
jgi:hypothetical protein